MDVIEPDFVYCSCFFQDESLARVCDRLGAVPFEYVKKEQWGTWNEFLDEHKDVWWPPKNA